MSIYDTFINHLFFPLTMGRNIILGAIQASTHLTEEEKTKINSKQVDLTLIQNLKQRALQKYEQLIKDAAAKNIHVLGLGEVFAGPFFPAVANDPNWKLFAEHDHGPTITKMQQLAKEYNMVLIVPFYEKHDNKFYNTTAVIDANGDFLGKYRKIHIPTGWGFNEQDYFASGNLGIPVFQTHYGKVGIAICFDRHFLSIFRVLKKRGAEIVYIPSATVENTSQYIWDSEIRMRAYDDKFYVVAINRVGQEGIGGLASTRFYGKTSIIDPRGRIIKQAGTVDDEIVFAEVEVEESIKDAQARYPTSKFRLPILDYHKDVHEDANKKRFFQ